MTILSFLAVVDCGLLLHPLNGMRIGDDTVYNSTVEFVCNVGYNLSSGSALRTCLANGLWSGQEPQCTSKLIVSSHAGLSV